MGHLQKLEKFEIKRQNYHLLIKRSQVQAKGTGRIIRRESFQLKTMTEILDEDVKKIFVRVPKIFPFILLLFT